MTYDDFKHAVRHAHAGTGPLTIADLRSRFGRDLPRSRFEEFLIQLQEDGVVRLRRRASLLTTLRAWLLRP